MRTPLENASPLGTNVVKNMMNKAKKFVTGKSGSETRIDMMRASDSPYNNALVACAYAKLGA